MSKKRNGSKAIIFRVLSLLVISVWIISVYVMVGDYIIKHKLLVFISTTALLAILILIGILKPNLVFNRIKKRF